VSIPPVNTILLIIQRIKKNGERTQTVDYRTACKRKDLYYML
jgi:hypothetical protein